jgi:predicted RNA-binding Zn-ribbon protein involved in translation (DUF1610 family)
MSQVDIQGRGTELTPPAMPVHTKTKLKCPCCGQKEMARVSRRGFLRERILPIAGLYPWQCAMCGEERLLRRRGVRIKNSPRRNDELEPGEAAGEHAHQH